MTLNFDRGRQLNAQILHITPRHRERSINYASKKHDTKIEAPSWDRSQNYAIFAATGRYGIWPNITRALIEEEVKTMQLESKKTKEILCQPLASHSFRLTEDDVDYIAKVYSPFVGLPAGINAVINEYDYRCLEKEKKIRLRLKRKFFEDATNGNFNRVRKYILKDMRGEE